ncbi:MULTISPECIES: LmbU family transcriptional regulator [Streptomyces]|uniref:LmbU family transcriptional regulator n=1 Tax=Streptomyces TaxID=1883 RepID=UPI0027384E5F|nr:LmbU family transcriptional regulator [Streptomyces sp. M54]
MTLNKETSAVVLEPGGRSRRQPHVDAGSRRASPQGGDGVLATRVGLRIPAGLEYEVWERAGQRIARVADSSAWCLGDWIIYGETRYTDRYRRAVKAAGLDYQTIRNYAWVARRFDHGRRRSALSFQHHAEVAAMEPEQQDYWLDQAKRFGWSRNELRRNIRAARQGKAEPAAVPETLPRIKASPERLQRWRLAAERSGSTLEEWIAARLDAAATTMLGLN